MPIYEYQCQACHKTSEHLEKMSDPPRTTCPYCSKNTLTRLVSPGNFKLKGSGWYAPESSPQSTDKKPDASTDSANKDTTTD